MIEELDVVERVAKWGEKMIEVRVRFWTNDIAKVKGSIIPKHAWDCGVVHIQRNAAHGIKPGNPIPFHSLMDMNAKIEEVLIEHGIKIHPSEQMCKYIKS